ncbi:MAG TPA: MFS transporter [Streptosporangiaceae bacterium]|nr:MFS transporter [Streptosporangiaceae bacterium]
MFPDAERTKAIGIWGAASAVSMAAGPILGGWLLGRFRWGSVFLINVPLTVIAPLAAWALVRCSGSVRAWSRRPQPSRCSARCPRPGPGSAQRPTTPPSSWVEHSAVPRARDLPPPPVPRSSTGSP